MNILIRSDSSSQIGLGHVIRDLVLAERYPDDSIYFACRQLSGNIIDRIHFPVHLLTTDTPEELIGVIQNLKIDMVIFDHYSIDSVYEKTVKQATGVKILCVDDTYASHHCDILLNPNLYADPLRYRSLVPETCTLQCGKEFLLIRKEFFDLQKHPKSSSNAIFVSLGGSDPKNLTLPVLKTLGDDFQINCITTSANPSLEMLQSYATSHPNVHLYTNISNIAELMVSSRYAIITPSSIAHEAITLKLPFIAIQSASNQDEFVRYLKSNNYPVIEHFSVKALHQALEEFL